MKKHPRMCAGGKTSRPHASGSSLESCLVLVASGGLGQTARVIVVTHQAKRSNRGKWEP